MHSHGPARLLIVDDHDLVRAGLRDLLADEADIQVIDEAKDGREAEELCRRLRPELILMDVRMPWVDGLEATRRIKETHPGIGVLMLTMHESSDYLLEALKAGAAGYVLKDSPREVLLTAIRGVLSGESPLAPELAAGLLRRLIDEVGPSKGVPQGTQGYVESPVEPLTRRELEVLRLVTLGQTNGEIARSLVVSSSTVKSHVQHIIAKLGVSDRTQAAVRAVECRLVTTTGP
jgi:DNA-binding NarL/FixJ family response regulator